VPCDPDSGFSLRVDDTYGGSRRVHDRRTRTFTDRSSRDSAAKSSFFFDAFTDDVQLRTLHLAPCAQIFFYRFIQFFTNGCRAA
jgi:hypothetical protein